MKPFNVTKLTKESWLGMAPHVLIPLQKAPQGARPNPKGVPFTTGCFSHDRRASQALWWPCTGACGDMGHPGETRGLCWAPLVDLWDRGPPVAP